MPHMEGYFLFCTASSNEKLLEKITINFKKRRMKLVTKKKAGGSV